MLLKLARRAAVLFAIAGAAGCTVHQAATPTPSGPSTLAHVVTMTAIPDSISQDGASQSSVVASAFGPSGQPEAGVILRMDMYVGGVLVDYGTLSGRSIVTGTDGKARAVYTAPPPAPPPGGNTINAVSIRATPIGFDAATDIQAAVNIRLVPPGVILPPADTPVAVFQYSPSPVTTNSLITFDASSSCGGPIVNLTCPSGSSAITSYSWSFGDGGSATGRVATHTFTAAGPFTVLLSVTNARGAAASTTQNLTVSGSAAPSAKFQFSPTTPTPGQTIVFNAAEASAAAGRTITQYSWIFGDGGTANGSLVSHVFATAGTYNVTLTVVDDAGGRGTQATSVTVSNGGGSVGSTAAAFAFSPLTPSAGQPVFFNASSSTASTGHTIATYGWDFGDGTIITGATNAVTHTFAAAGSFTVTLTVTDDAGQKGSTKQPVTVSPAGTGSLTAEFSFSPTDPHSNQLVSFNASLSTPLNTIVTYDWDFGDGVQISGLSSFLTSHTYFTPTGNSFAVKLTVHDNSSPSKIAIVVHNVPVIVGQDPVASFTVSPSPAVLGGGASVSVHFDPTSSSAFAGSAGPPVVLAHQIQRFEWDFGDGTAVVSTTPLPNPPGPTINHPYTAAGTYIIRMTVFDDHGLSNTTSRTLQVQP